MTNSETRAANTYIAEKTRKLCIKENYYTRGDNKAYDNLLSGIIDGRISSEIEITLDICEHSNNADYEIVLKGVRKIINTAISIWNSEE